MLKVLQVHNYYKTRGGECSVVDAERTLLEEQGQGVIPYYSDSCDIEELGVIEKANLLLRVPYNRDVERDLAATIRREKPDVAHVHNIFPMLTTAVYKALRSNGVPVVQTVHNLRFLCPNGQFYTHNHICEECQNIGYISAVKNRCMQDSFLISGVYAAAISRAWKTGILPNSIDRYIALNRFYAGRLIAAGVPSSRIRILGNFVDSRETVVPKKSGYVLYLGRLSREKGIRTLLSAWGDLDCVTLKIAGSGPMEEEVHQLAAYFGETRVQVLGYVAGDAKLELIRGAICIVVPSEWYENFPISIVEAMSLGTPVVASNIGGLPDMVEHEKTGLLFESGSSVALAEALRIITSDPNLASRLALNALRAAHDFFDHRKHYDGLIEVYSEAIAGHDK